MHFEIEHLEKVNLKKIYFIPATVFQHIYLYQSGSSFVLLQGHSMTPSYPGLAPRGAGHSCK